MLQNDILLRVAKGQPTDRPPVWLMRQAGRFLTEYRETRARAGSFRAMIANPEFAAEVTLQPVDLVGVDAAIIFSDILVVPEAMGLPYDMVEARGPVFPEVIRSRADLGRLRPVEGRTNLDDTIEAMRIVKDRLQGRVPLIGFAGAPWTIFCYMTEGKGSKTFSVAKSILYRDPEFAHDLLGRITDATIIYLKQQVEAGADLIQVFDSWAELLDRDTYRIFALPYIRKIVEAIPGVPRTVFAKGAFFALEDIAGLPSEVIGLDWHVPLEYAHSWVGNKVTQGNLDPCVLYGSRASVQDAVKRLLSLVRPGKHIVNLGHGIYPDTPRENVIAMIEAVKSWKW